MHSRFAALSLLVAAPLGAQDAMPTGPAPVAAVPDPATAGLNGAVQAKLDAVAATNRQNMDAYATQLAAFREAQASFQRAKAANDAEQASAAAAKRAYEADLASWQAATAGAKAALPAPKPPTEVVKVAARDQPEAVPKRVCRDEGVTGSTIPKRRCRTVEQTKQADAAGARSVEAFKAAAERGNIAVPR